MTCREFVEFLDRFVNGDLSPDEAAEFERHLAVCASCVRYLESYRQTIRLAREALAGHGDQDVTKVPAVPEELVAAILAARKK